MIPIYIETYGCTLNQSDSELMTGLLLESGYESVGTPEDSSLIIVNTCTVKTPTVKNLYRRLDELKKLKKPFVIAGCIPQVDQDDIAKHLNKSIFSLIGTHQLMSIVEVVEATLEGNSVILIAEENQKRLNLVSPKEGLISILPISKGCLGSCTYCQTKKARGDLHSYSIHDIETQARKSILNGAKEIWITSQDTAAYGKDIGKDLCELLSRLIKIDGLFFIRLGMANPNHVLGMVDELIEIFKSPKMFKFLHIPLQSGDDRILKSMGREYTVKEFKEIVLRFREKIPHISIATDVICGFPGETDEMFDNTLELIKEIRPSVVNISRFYSRPGTPAEKMKQIHGKVTKERSRQMTRLFENISLLNNEEWIDWKGNMIIEVAHEDYVSGRNIYYKPISLKKGKVGEIVRVGIYNARTFHLLGKQKTF